MFQQLLCVAFFLAELSLISCYNKTVDVSRECQDVLYRVDYAEEMWVKGGVEYNHTQSAWWRKLYNECRVTFETGQDQGLCVHMQDLDIVAEGVSIEFLASAYRPVKHYDKSLTTGGSWCTHKNLVTMVVKMIPGETFLQPDAFHFAFRISSKPLEQIEKVYNMGSPAFCDMHYILKADETAIIKSNIYPTTDPAPTVCQMNFTSLSTEEYGQVCVWIERYDVLAGCDMNLTIDGLDTDYWSKTVKYNCDDRKNATEEVCSKDRMLTVHLSRGKGKNSARFDLKIANKWMAHWESAEGIKTEISYMTAAKSLTVLIATLDTVIALAAAFISIASRYPYGRLKVIGDMFGKDPTVPHHYGNDYPVAIAVTSGETDPPPF